MKLPFVFISLRGVVREIRSLGKTSERIADALDRAWPKPVDSGEPPREEDFIGYADHVSDDELLKREAVQAMLSGDESKLEALMEKAFDKDFDRDE